MNERFRALAICVSLALLSSCASYVTPGGPADLTTFTNPSIKEAFTAEPAIHFPANLAVVRVQESGYRSYRSQGYGEGAYSVVTTRDIETEDDLQALADLPGIADVVTLNRLLIPHDLKSDLALRTAAARLHADAILIYTLDTNFNDGKIIDPLTTLTLGLAPNKHYKINAVASAVLIDTRTGYVYGALEELDSRSGLTIAWGSDQAIDNACKKAEREALNKLLAAFPPFWAKVYQRHR